MSASGQVRALRAAVAAIVLAAVLAAALGGCGEGGKSQSSGTVNTMKVTAGRDFTLSLKSNQTTGYQWQLDGPLDEKVVRYESKEYKADQSRAGQNVGAGGVEIWKFKAVGKGSTDIRMKYVRPWEKDTKPAEQRVFKVTVD